MVECFYKYNVYAWGSLGKRTTTTHDMIWTTLWPKCDKVLSRDPLGGLGQRDEWKHNHLGGRWDKGKSLHTYKALKWKFEKINAVIISYIFLEYCWLFLKVLLYPTKSISHMINCSWKNNGICLAWKQSHFVLITETFLYATILVKILHL